MFTELFFSSASAICHDTRRRIKRHDLFNILTQQWPQETHANINVLVTTAIHQTNVQKFSKISKIKQDFHYILSIMSCLPKCPLLCIKYIKHIDTCHCIRKHYSSLFMIGIKFCFLILKMYYRLADAEDL